jgi:Uma2 family endonuclease
MGTWDGGQQPKGAAVIAMLRRVSESADSLHLLTIAEYAELGETEPGYTELIEGRLLMSPSPAPDHNNAIFELGTRLRSFVPPKFEVQLELDIDLGLVEPGQPGFSRRPDLIVVDRAARERVREFGGLIRASEVLVVVEIVSPGSRRTDHVDKRRDYADAGIPHYWIVDVDDPITLTACYLTEEFGYRDHGVVTDVFRTETPFAAEVELARLR